MFTRATICVYQGDREGRPYSRRIRKPIRRIVRATLAVALVQTMELTQALIVYMSIEQFVPFLEKETDE